MKDVNIGLSILTATMVGIFLIVGLPSVPSSKSKEVATEPEIFTISKYKGDARILKDNETGCQYIYFMQRLQPRLNKEGKIMCD